MIGARRGTLAGRLLVGFLAVTVPGTLVLGAVTPYSIQSLGEVNRQLEEVSWSLDATRDLHLALIGAAALPQKYLLCDQRECQQEFDRLIRAAKEKITFCSSAVCHGASRTPREMARLLIPTIERLRNEGWLIFQTTPSKGRAEDLRRIEEIDRLFSGTNRQLQRMSAPLFLRGWSSGTSKRSWRPAAATAPGLPRSWGSPR